MSKAKIFYIFSAIYIALGLLFFALNGFSLSKSVVRRTMDPRCDNSVSAGSSLFNSACVDTLELRHGYQKTWVQWQFMSSYRGFDVAHYWPVDIVLLLVADGAVFLLTRKRQPKK